MLMIVALTSYSEFRVRIPMWFGLESPGTPVFIFSQTKFVLVRDVVMSLQIIFMVLQLLC